MKTRYEIKATIYSKKGLMSTGFNNYIKSHPLQAHFAKLANQPDRIFLHAEIDACIRAGLGKPFDFEIEYPETICVECRDKYGRYKNAKPCPVCILAIEAFGIKYIDYTTESGWIRGKKVEEIKAEYQHIYNQGNK